MTYEKALLVFRLNTLAGQNEGSLKKIFRTLAKSRHTDNYNKFGYVKDNFTITDTKEAYQVLIERLHSGNIETKTLNIKPSEYLSMRQYKEKLKLSGTPELNYVSWLERTDVKVATVLNVLVLDGISGAPKLETSVTQMVSATENFIHGVGLWVPCLLGDTLQIKLDDCFDIECKMVSPIFSVKIPVRIDGPFVKSLEFNITIRQQDQNKSMEVQLW